MIGVPEARQIIQKNVPRTAPKTVKLLDALGLILAEDVFSPIDFPPFNQSSVDGYAFAFSDFIKNPILEIEGEVPAGTLSSKPLRENSTCRIFTGAPVPEGADTIVMQEKTKVANGFLQIEDPNLVQGSNFRSKGFEIKKAEKALEKGTKLVPGAIGFLAGLGIAEISVFPKPRISIILTGNELQKPGFPLLNGQIYESNSFIVMAMLQQLHVGDNVQVFYPQDTLNEIASDLKIALEQSDLVLLTGGVSVGDYDFVPKAAALCEVEVLFHKVKQKPGKPIFFGKKENKIVIGLPGNPASVLTCLYEYVLEVLHLMTGSVPNLETRSVALSSEIRKPAGLTHFLKGFFDGKSVSLLPAQESYRLSSFSKANCLIHFPEDDVLIEKGKLVDIHLFPA